MTTRTSNPNHETTVRGIVVPTEWNNKGEALRVAILTAGERQFEVCASGLGNDLLANLREEIEARISIIPNRGDTFCCTVVSYSIINTAEEIGLSANSSASSPMWDKTPCL